MNAAVYALSDTLAMTGRVMRHMLRSIDTIITVIIMPVLIMLAFVYIFGGAMTLPAGVDYKGFVLPGILLFTVASGTSYTAYRLNVDVTQGIFERFHSMPIAKSSILGGHIVTSVIFNMVSMAVVFAVALLIGYRPAAGPLDYLPVVALLLLFTIAVSWMAAFFGLLANNGDTAVIFTYPIMALIFTSSSFAPVSSMPGPLQVFAQVQPLTPIIDSCRALLNGGGVGTEIWVALAWTVLLLVVFQALSSWAYHKRLR
jgi:ABC-2 type transport system permease protein